MMATEISYLKNLLDAVDKSRNVQCSMNHRSSRSEVFCKKGILKNLPKFTETLAQVFFYEFCEYFMNSFFNRTPLVVAS